jgi:ABC-type polysaccharide/polyol phosphate transport system ATPase subunit
MNDTIITAKSLSKRFYVLKKERTFLRALKAVAQRNHIQKELWVLKDINFTIKKGEKIALIGRNGCGKTTLLRILTGTYDKTGGYFETRATPLSLYRYMVGASGDLSVTDNIFLFGALYGLDRRFLNPRLGHILENAELSHLAFSPLKELSSGERERLSLSIFSHVQSDFLIFDEGLAFIDRKFSEKCRSYFHDLLASEKTVIITGHDRSFLKELCTRALWLDDGRIRMSGGVNEVFDEYERSCRN